MVGILIGSPIISMSNLSFTAMLNSMIESIGEENIYLIDVNVTDKVADMLKFKQIKTIHVPFGSCRDWIEYETLLSKTIPEDLKTLITYGNTLNRTFRREDTDMVDRFEKKLKEKAYKHCASFVYVRTILCRYMIVKYCVNKSVKLLHWVIDPQEFDYARYFKTGKTLYYLNKDYMEYVPSYESYLFKRGVYVGKKYDFLFYGTATTNDRKYLLDSRDSLKAIRKSNVGILAKESSDVMMPQVKYYEKLSKTKFTLIIPSYDVTTFSMIRFLEAVANYCLPLVLDTCDLTDVKNTFPDIYDFIKKYLIVSIDEIQKKIDQLDYEKLITEMYRMKTIKRFFDKDFLKGAWDKYLR